jgi:transcription termination/antitermination protein NusG
MPLLALEPSIYPESLLAEPVAPATTEERWWVLHTRPRAEKALARHCVNKELPFYLPLHHKKWRSGGRMQQSFLPLFPGYVFLYGDEQVRYGALETNLVAHAIPVVDQQQLQTDLSQLYRLIESEAAVTPEDRLAPGSPVRIVHGPLAGLEGKVLRRDKNCRFFIEVRLLQRAVSAEIESWMIEAV